MDVSHQHMMFSHTLGEVMMIFTAIVFGWPLPLLPLQILWMNVVTDVFPALALAVEPASPEIMKQRPRDPSQALLSKKLLILIAWQAAMIATLALLAYVAKSVMWRSAFLASSQQQTSEPNAT